MFDNDEIDNKPSEDDDRLERRRKEKFCWGFFSLVVLYLGEVYAHLTNNALTISCLLKPRKQKFH